MGYVGTVGVALACMLLLGFVGCSSEEGGGGGSESTGSSATNGGASSTTETSGSESSNTSGETSSTTTGDGGTGPTTSSEGTTSTSAGGMMSAGGTTSTGSSSGGAASTTSSGGNFGLEVLCTESSVGCLCTQLSNPPEDEVLICSPASVNGYCCADEGFPEFGFCTCRDWTCEEDEFGCNCIGGSDGSSAQCNQTWTTCCMNTIDTASSCFCDDTPVPCSDGWIEVDTCTREMVPCGSGETPIDYCKEI